MVPDTELEPQGKLPGAPTDEPPIEKMTEEQAKEQYDDPKDASFEDRESSDKLAEEVGFKVPPREGDVEGDAGAEDETETEVTDAAEDSTSEEPEQKVDEVSASLRERAINSGVPDYMIESLKTADLERFVHEAFMKSGQAQRQPEVKPEAKPEPPPEPKDFQFDFDSTVMDDEVRLSIESNLQRMHSQHQSDMEAVRKENSDIRTRMDANAQQAQQEALIQERVRFDEWVASQNDVDLFGKGASSAMDVNSAQYRARSEVWVNKNRIAAGIIALGEPMQTEGQILEWASNSVHARTNGKQAATEVGKTLKKSASQTLARAGTNRPKTLSKLDEFDASFEEMRMNDPGRDESLEEDAEF